VELFTIFCFLAAGNSIEKEKSNKFSLIKKYKFGKQCALLHTAIMNKNEK